MSKQRASLVGGVVVAIILTAVPAALAAHHPTQRTPANCVRDQLSVRSGGINGGAGTIHGAWVFTNRSATACVLNGYPDLQLYNRGGRPILTTVVQDIAPGPTAVTLLPDASGTFFSSYNDVSSGSGCRTSAVMQVTAPNDAAPLFIPAQLQACGGVVHVSAVRAGVHHA